ncbi:HNH endonuclease [Candidatus Saccharibacteria bacterium]|nr:HNH endonuclease [Candidatus Saccharibacteria bacterium]
MKLSYRSRRIISVVVILAVVAGWLIINPGSYEKEVVQADFGQVSLSRSSNTENGDNQSLSPLGASSSQNDSSGNAKLARIVLDQLEIKGRAPKTGYSREEFYKSWPNVNGCSLRQIIIRREVGESAVMDGCDVVGGTFVEPYTGSELSFYQKSDFSKKIQIDHIVALSDAWQKGAQYMERDVRYAIATDPLNLLAVDSVANQQKSDGDAATWLPPNKAFRCQYVARQVSVKKKYNLWVTQAEHDAINTVLETCPNEQTIGLE